LEGKGFYIAPTSYVIGISHESVLDRQTGYMKTNVNEAQGQYISITQMIKALHANTDLIDQVLHANMNPASGEYLLSFFDGLFWKNHAMKNEKVIHLRLYGDDGVNLLNYNKCLFLMSSVT